MRGRLPRVALAVTGAACIALAIWTVGLPGTLLLVGGWLLATGLSLAVPGLRGPASWAAAIVVEVAVLTCPGLSAASALVSPAPAKFTYQPCDPRSPRVLGCNRRVRRFLVQSTASDVRPLARRCWARSWSVVVAGLGIARWVTSLGQDYGVSWAMSGDTRNEVLLMRGVIQAGGLTVGRLRTYPALVNNVISLISEAGGRAGAAPHGNLMLHDVHAFATVYVLAAIAIALMLIATLVEIMPGPLVLSPNGLPVDVLVVLLACGITSASPLLLGMALRGGLRRWVCLPASLPVVIAAIAADRATFLPRTLTFTVGRAWPCQLDYIRLLAAHHFYTWSAVGDLGRFRRSDCPCVTSLLCTHRELGPCRAASELSILPRDPLVISFVEQEYASRTGVPFELVPSSCRRRGWSILLACLRSGVALTV